MRIKYWIEKGKVKSVADLNTKDKQTLCRKNLQMLRDNIAWRKVFEETVSFADKELTHEPRAGE